MRFRQFVLAAACVTVLFASVTAAGAMQLVTDQEAMLPDDSLGEKRGVTRGPDIVVVSPAANAGLVRSPLTLKIKLAPSPLCSTLTSDAAISDAN